MAEVGTEVVTEKPVITAPSIEDQAKEMGWRPQDEYDGEPTKWVDANIFVARAPLFEKIEQQNKRLKETDKTLQELKAFQSKIAETEYKRALDTLKHQRRAALEEGDVVAAEDIRDQMDELKQKPPVETKINAVPKEFTDWVEDNPWYESDEDMRDFADSRGNKLGKNGDLSPAQVLKRVAEDTKKAFPDKFKARNPARDRVSSVETESSAGTFTSSKAFKLSAEEEQVCSRFVKQGVMSREDYIKELKKTRG